MFSENIGVFLLAFTATKKTLPPTFPIPISHATACIILFDLFSSVNTSIFQSPCPGFCNTRSLSWRNCGLHARADAEVTLRHSCSSSCLLLLTPAATKYPNLSNPNRTHGLGKANQRFYFRPVDRNVLS